ncbi:MAG TPA: T9SS type A sorting domain-containing protein, partial [Bacteroidia bacterium]|nr:T9SS type A sorting domain-containing protein [Bacteroidia bacterium]
SSGLADVPASVWRVTGINSIPNPANKVTTWPVPASSQLNVKVTSIDEGKANIDLYDVTGRLVKEMSTELKPGDNSITFNTDDLSSGIYSLAIKGERINVCTKIVISR